MENKELNIDTKAVETTPLDTKRIEILVRECQTKDGKKKFNTFKAVQKNGKIIDCKFRKEITPPTEDCYITCDVKDINMERNTKYPCLWVKAIKLIELKADIADNAINGGDYTKLNEMF